MFEKKNMVEGWFDGQLIGLSESTTRVELRGSGG